MALSVLLSYQDLVLNMEVRDIVFEVDVFGYDEGSNYLIVYFGNKPVIDTSWVDCTLIERLVHLLCLV